MKKLLGLTLSLAAVGFMAPSAEAKTASASAFPAAKAANYAAEPQWRDRNRRVRNNRRVYVTTHTSYVRQGRRVYRETYQVRHLPNGRTQTRLISRVRVR